MARRAFQKEGSAAERRIRRGRVLQEFLSIHESSFPGVVVGRPVMLKEDCLEPVTPTQPKCDGRGKREDEASESRSRNPTREHPMSGCGCAVEGV
jgi:hypothetical protein